MKTQIELKLEIIDRIIAVHSQMRVIEKEDVNNLNTRRYNELENLLILLNTELKNV